MVLEFYKKNNRLDSTSRKAIVEMICYHTHHFKLQCGPKEFLAITEKIILLFPTEIKVNTQKF